MFRYRLIKRAGEGKRSETHQFLAEENDGLCKGSPHPAECDRALADRGGHATELSERCGK